MSTTELISKQIEELENALNQYNGKYSDIENYPMDNSEKDRIDQLFLPLKELMKNNNTKLTSKQEKDIRYLEFRVSTIEYNEKAYEISERINDVNGYIGKVYEVENKAIELDKKINSFTIQSDNLVYTILSFMASFSIISASVTAFDKVNSVFEIVIFMTFAALLLTTTLIVIDNFYKGDARLNSKSINLKNNYFLWIVIVVIIIVLLIVMTKFENETNVNAESINPIRNTININDTIEKEIKSNELNELNELNNQDTQSTSKQ